MLVELIRVTFAANGSCNIGKIRINPDHKSYIAEDTNLSLKLQEGKIDLGLREEVGFTKIHLFNSGVTSFVTVIGNPDSIEEKIVKHKRKQLLRG